MKLEMGKAPKLQLSFLNTIQICRPKDVSSLVKTPVPLLTHFSTLNSKTHDISLPTFQDPPPSPSNINPLRPKSSDLNDDHHPSRPHSRTRIEKKKETSTSKECRARSTSNTSSFSLVDHNKDQEGLNIPLMKQTSVRTRRFKRYGSKEWKDGSCITKEPSPCMVDRKVVMDEERFIVVKRSVDPYEDFKKSMLEMILEKQMFEPKELEHLLMTFLSLNSRIHHKAILRAFSQIWKQLFSGPSN